MNETTSTFTGTTQPSHDEISRKAKELWETYGRPAGRDEEIWLEAERALQSPASNPAAEPTKDTTPRPPRANTRESAGGATATPRMPGARNKRSV
jgi:Protein of unknown function (DUF2934).